VFILDYNIIFIFMWNPITSWTVVQALC